MNRRRFIISAAIVFIVVEILDYIIHQIILQSTYMVLRSVLRPEAEMQSKRWIVFVTALIWPFLFVYIYTKGYEGREVVEGKRYGLWIGLFSLFQWPIAGTSYCRFLTRWIFSGPSISGCSSLSAAFC